MQNEDLFWEPLLEMEMFCIFNGSLPAHLEGSLYFIVYVFCGVLCIFSILYIPYNIIICRHCHITDPLSGESTGDLWINLTRGQ